MSSLNTISPDAAITVQKQGCRKVAYDYDDSLAITWLLTQDCNFRCSYCFIHGESGEAKDGLVQSVFPTMEQCDNAIDNLFRLNRNFYHFYFYGGEPTLYHDLFLLVEKIRERFGDRCGFSIITNGSKSADYYLRLFETAHEKIDFWISIHPEFATYDHIYSLTTALTPKARVIYRIMTPPGSREKWHKLAHDLCELRKDHPFDMASILLRQPPLYQIHDGSVSVDDFEKVRLIDAHFRECLRKPGVPKMKLPVRRMELFWDIFVDGRREFLPALKANPNYFRSRDKYLDKGLLSFENMWCAMGTNVMIIYSSGKYGGAICPAKICQGNIYHKDVDVRREFPLLVRCSLPKCGCRGNDGIPKFSNFDEAKHFMRGFKRHLLDGPASHKRDYQINIT